MKIKTKIDIILKIRLFQILVLFIIFIQLTGCGVAEPHSSSIGLYQWYQLIYKSKDFLVFCLFLSTQEPPFWGQIISRLYYSYFHLARIVHIGKANFLEEEKHDVIWQQNKKNVRKCYGKSLKKLRTYYDYDADSVGEKSNITKSNIKKIVEDSKHLKELIDDAKKQTIKFYKREENPNKWINDFNIIFEDIEKIHADLMNILNKKQFQNVKPKNTKN